MKMQIATNPPVKNMPFPAASDYMGAEQLAFFKSLLLAEQDVVLQRKAQHQADAGHASTNHEADPNDRASMEESRSQMLALCSRDDIALQQIQAALIRINSGDYGWCADTGDEIGVERLTAYPVATLCVEAQARREAQQRHFAN